jgi:3-hydroxyacyl-[acyl-carrier-protein] dehydratase
MSKFDKDAIKAIIPHREPMLLVDEIETDPEDPNSVYGYYTVRGDEYFLQGHFPGKPIVPGVILCEMMAQSSCPLLTERNVRPMFTSLNNVKFKAMVQPGDTVKFHVTLNRKNGPFYFASGKGYLGEKVCVVAELSFVAVKNEEE